MVREALSDPRIRLAEDARAVRNGADELGLASVRLHHRDFGAHRFTARTAMK